MVEVAVEMDTYDRSIVYKPTALVSPPRSGAPCGEACDRGERFPQVLAVPDAGGTMHGPTDATQPDEVVLTHSLTHSQSLTTLQGSRTTYPQLPVVPWEQAHPRPTGSIPTQPLNNGYTAADRRGSPPGDL